MLFKTVTVPVPSQSPDSMAPPSAVAELLDKRTFGDEEVPYKAAFADAIVGDVDRAAVESGHIV